MRRRAALALCLALLATAAEADEREAMIKAAIETQDGLQHLEANRRSVELLGRALLIDSSDVDGGFTLAMRLRKRMLLELDVENGAPFLELLCRLYPHDETIYGTDRAWLLVNAGRTEEGARAYAALLAEDPDNVQVALALAGAEALLGRTAEARAVCEEIIRRTNAPRAHLFHGRFLLWQGGSDAAVARALAAARNSADALPPEERVAFLAEVAREEEILGSLGMRREAIRSHLGRVDRTLLVVCAGWLVLLAGGGWFLRRRGWL